MKNIFRNVILFLGIIFSVNSYADLSAAHSKCSNMPATYDNTTTYINCMNYSLTDDDIKDINFSQFTNLRRLDLGYNQLTTFTSDLPNSLQYLDLSLNQLTTFTNILPNSLEYLYLHNNQLTTFTNILPNSLFILTLSSNQLTTFTNNLPDNLDTLMLDNNQLTTFTNNSLPNSLQVLSLNNNQLTEFTNILPNSLRYLYLNNNNIIEFNHSEDISNSTSFYLNSKFNILSKVTLNNNVWNKVWNGIGGSDIDMIKTNLTNIIDNGDGTTTRTEIQVNSYAGLSAAHSKCSNMPTTYDNTTIAINCANSNLTDDDIKDIDFSQFTNLQYLDLNNNQLEAFTNSLPNSLQYLILYNNKLKVFTNSELPNSLQQLSLNFNQLTTFTNILPNSLQYLGLNSNQLTTFTNILPNSLLTLDLTLNQLTTFTSDLPDSLRFLYLSHNQLTTFTNILPNSLQSLFLSSNQLTTFTNILPNSLQDLYLNNNYIKEFNPLKDISYLKYFFLNSNTISKVTLNNNVWNKVWDKLWNGSDGSDINIIKTNLPNIIDNGDGTTTRTTIPDLSAAHSKCPSMPATYDNTTTFINCDNYNLTDDDIKDIDFSQFTNLQYLFLNSNKLETFTNNLPDSLQYLFLNNNKLTTFTNNLPNSLSLRYLNLSNNQLNTFTNDLPNSLQSLYLNNNKLTTFTNNLPNNLVSLGLSDNQLTEFTNNLPNSLLVLYLNNNQLTEFNPLKDISYLKYFFLNSNTLSKVTLNNNVWDKVWDKFWDGSDGSDINDIKTKLPNIIDNGDGTTTRTKIQITNPQIDIINNGGKINNGTTIIPNVNDITNIDCSNCININTLIPAIINKTNFPNATIILPININCNITDIPNCSNPNNTNNNSASTIKNYAGFIILNPSTANGQQTINDIRQTKIFIIENKELDTKQQNIKTIINQYKDTNNNKTNFKNVIKDLK